MSKGNSSEKAEVFENIEAHLGRLRDDLDEALITGDREEVLEQCEIFGDNLYMINAELPSKPADYVTLAQDAVNKICCAEGFAKLLDRLAQICPDEEEVSGVIYYIRDLVAEINEHGVALPRNPETLLAWKN